MATKDSTEVERLTATQIAIELSKEEEFKGIQAGDVNRALLEMGYIKQSEGGYILLIEKFGQQLRTSTTGSNPNKIPYVKWNPLILKNTAFRRVLQELKGTNQKGVLEKVVDTVKEAFAAPAVQKPELPREEKQVFKKPFDRKTFEAPFLTASGHFVRSQAELLVANFLYSNMIPFSYERRLPIEEECYTDFFIPGKNVYIEYWGFENKPEYLARKKVKKDIYKKYGFNLVELDSDDLKTLDDNLAIKLLKYGVHVS